MREHNNKKREKNKEVLIRGVKILLLITKLVH